MRMINTSTLQELLLRIEDAKERKVICPSIANDISLEIRRVLINRQGGEQIPITPGTQRCLDMLCYNEMDN